MVSGGSRRLDSPHPGVLQAASALAHPMCPRAPNPTPKGSKRRWMEATSPWGSCHHTTPHTQPLPQPQRPPHPSPRSLLFLSQMGGAQRVGPWGTQHPARHRQGTCGVDTTATVPCSPPHQGLWAHHRSKRPHSPEAQGAPQPHSPAWRDRRERVSPGGDSPSTYKYGQVEEDHHDLDEREEPHLGTWR